MRFRSQRLIMIMATALLSRANGFVVQPLRGGSVVDASRLFSSRRNTGGLRRLPVVKAPSELLDKARKVAHRVPADR